MVDVVKWREYDWLERVEDLNQLDFSLYIEI